MKQSTYYTAIGHFRRKTDEAGHSYPDILVNQEENIVDIQEMVVWTILNWRFLRLEQIEAKYEQMSRDLPRSRRMLETCLNRLETRGLIARAAVRLILRRCMIFLENCTLPPSQRACPCGLSPSESCYWTASPSPKRSGCSRRTSLTSGRSSSRSRAFAASSSF